MASRQEFELVADGVDIQTLWRALTKDKIEVIRKSGRRWNGPRLTLISAPDLESFTERIVEFDEEKHVLTFLGVEGGYMNLGFTHYLVTFKLDDGGGGKTMLNASVKYDLNENFDGGQLLDGFLKLLRYYLDSVIGYLQQTHED